MERIECTRLSLYPIRVITADETPKYIEQAIRRGGEAHPFTGGWGESCWSPCCGGRVELVQVADSWSSPKGRDRTGGKREGAGAGSIVSWKSDA